MVDTIAKQDLRHEPASLSLLPCSVTRRVCSSPGSCRTHFHLAFRPENTASDTTQSTGSIDRARREQGEMLGFEKADCLNVV